MIYLIFITICFLGACEFKIIVILGLTKESFILEIVSSLFLIKKILVHHIIERLSGWFLNEIFALKSDDFLFSVLKTEFVFAFKHLYAQVFEIGPSSI